MGRNREPIKLIQAKGKTHLTKAEISERESAELSARNDNIVPPDFLSKKEQDRFYQIADELKALGIMSNLDCDVLGRYIKAESDFAFYDKMTSKTQKRLLSATLGQEAVIIDNLTKYENLKNRAFNQCHTCASALGMTITSRCKIVVPKAAETPKENKFSRFMKNGSG